MMNTTSRDASALRLLQTWREDYRRAVGVTALENANKLKNKLDITHAHPAGIEQFFASGRVALSELFRDKASITSAERELRNVLINQMLLRQENGFATLTLAVGVGKWEHYAVPVLLYQVDVADVNVDKQSGEFTQLSDAVLELRSNAVINPRFVAMLHEMQIQCDPNTIFSLAQLEDNLIDVSVALAKIDAIVSEHIPDFEIHQSSVIGSFINPDSVVLDEAERVVDRMLEDNTGNVLLDGIMGNPQAVERIRHNPLPEFNPVDNDPHDELEIGDEDNATRYAARIVSNGGSVFLNTPSNSQTARYAAAIASRVVMSGKTALYVPGVSKARLNFQQIIADNEMSGITLDITDTSRNSVLDAQLIQAVSFQNGTTQSHFNQISDELIGVRGRLTQYINDLHGVNSDWGVSAYETIENLARISSLPTHPATRIRLSGQTAKNIANNIDTWGQKLVVAGKLGEFTINPEDTSWFGASLFTPAQATAAYQRVVRILNDVLPMVREQIRSVVSTCGFPVPEHITAWGKQLAVLKNLRSTLDVFQPDIFERDLPAMLSATLSSQERKALKREGQSTMGFWERRRIVREIRSLLRPGAHVDNLHDALQYVVQQSNQWHQFAPQGGWPVLPAKLDAMLETLDTLTSDVTALETVLATTPDGGNLITQDFVVLEHRLHQLYKDDRSLQQLPARMVLEKEFIDAGLGELVKDLRRRKIESEQAPDELQLSWWTTVFDLIVQASPIISNQDGSVLTSAADRFQQIDVEHVRSTGAMVYQTLTKRLAELLYAQADEANMLHTALANNQQISMNTLFSKYHEILVAAKPLMIASAAGAAAMLPLETVIDVAIVDASAHIESASLLPILARARQVVIIGHKETLSSPIVKTFSRLLNEVTVQVRPTRRDVRLNRFLRSEGYGRIIDVPSALSRPTTITFTRVHADGLPTSETGLVESSRAEIQAIVKLIEERAAQYPVIPSWYRLSIVCLTEAHRNRIEHELRNLVDDKEELRRFLMHIRLVLLHEVIGTPTHDVIFAVGYAPTVHGRLLQQFGPLENRGADQLLLDMIASCDFRFDVVSAFTADDMLDDRVRQPGARLLKRLLRFVEQVSRNDMNARAAMLNSAAHTSSQDSEENNSAIVVDNNTVAVESATQAESSETTDMDSSADSSSNNNAKVAEDRIADTSNPYDVHPHEHVNPQEILINDLAQRIRARGLNVLVGYGYAEGVRIPLAVGAVGQPLSLAITTDDNQFMSSVSLRERHRFTNEDLHLLGWNVLHIWSVAAFVNPEKEVDEIVSLIASQYDRR